MIEILKAIVLGIVEGITEWLPISSTGHMILFDEFLKLKVSADFKQVFLVVIQLGAVMPLIIIFFKRLNPFTSSKSEEEKKDTYSLWLKIIIGVIPAALAGLLLDDWLDAKLYNYITVATTLIIYGVLFIVIENWNKNREASINNFGELSYKMALFIGLFQILSLIPGTSRSGVTILGAIILGSSRLVAAEFSFLLSIPIMLGASLLKLVKFVMKGFIFSNMEVAILLTGCLVAFVVSFFAIKFLLSYIKKNDFKPFGIYRVALGVIIIAYFLIFS